MAGQQLTPPARWAIGLICIVMLGGMSFVAAFAMGLQSLMDALRVRNWIETPCTIERSYFDIDPTGEGERLTVQVEYSYVVDGRRYENDRIGASWLDTGDEQFVKDNPKGTQRSCYVNPDNPQQAVLIPNVPWQAWILSITCSVLFFLVGLFFTVAGLSFIRKERRETGMLPRKRGRPPVNPD